MILEQRFRALIMDRENLIFDSRFAAAAKSRNNDFVHLYIVRHGLSGVHGGPTFDTPVMFTLLDEEFDSIDAKSATFRAWGPLSSSLAIRLPKAMCIAPIGLSHGPSQLSAELCRAVDKLTAAIDNAATETATVEFFAQLEREHFVTPEMGAAAVNQEPDDMIRLWSAVAPLYGAFATSASMLQFSAATGLSLRQLSRNLTMLVNRYGIFGDGYRDASRVLRLRAATLLLSAEDVTATEVARIVGYSGLDSMGRALRDAKLPSPSEIRVALLQHI